MERITLLEAALEEFASLRFRSGCIHGSPFRWKTLATFKAPLGEFLCNTLSDALLPFIVEQATTHDFSNLRLIV